MILAMVLLVSLPFSAARAEAKVKLSLEKDKYDLGRGVEIFEDKSGRLNFDEVRAREGDWKLSRQDVLNFAFSDSVFWVRTGIENPGPNPRDLLLELAFPLHDYVDAYLEKSPGEFREVRTGDRRKFNTRAIDHHHFLFPVRVPAGGTRRVYLRFRSFDGLHETAPLILWDRNAFAEYDSLAGYFNGLLFGFLLIMLFYNLFVYFSLRDRSYLYYVLFLTASIFWFFSYQGMAFRVLWADFPTSANAVIPVATAAIALTHLLYVRSYLDTRLRTPRLDMLMRSIWVPWAFILLYSLFGSYKISILLVMLFLIMTIPVILLVAVIRARQGNRPARYYVSSFMVLLLGVFMVSLKVGGVLPSNVLTEKSIMVGYAVAVLLLALGLADRINVIREERAAAQGAALEKETLARRAQERAADDLRRMNELKDSFLANTSHELRTPLHGIIGMADALRDDKSQSLTPASDRRLEMIKASGRRLSRLVGDILDFSKLRYRDVQLRMSAVHLRSLVQLQLELIAYNRPSARELNLRNDVPADLPPVRADEERLTQILQNLLGNAVKFTSAGAIRVSARPIDGDLIEICVSDTGSGISSEDRERIFQPFEQAKGVTGGTGLGLSIARSLVELQGGQLRLGESDGPGTVLCFTLAEAGPDEDVIKTIVGQPRSPLEKILPSIPGAAESLASTKRDMKAAASENGARVLVVDDEPVNLEVMRSYLESSETRVETAVDAETARKLIGKGSLPDCLVLDIMMPGTSGLELARELRSEYSRTRLPILMVTAKTRTSDLIAALDAGANDYLTKPFEKKEFLVRVNNLVELAASYRDVERSRTAVLDAARHERSRINADLHDHLGASLTDLKLFSETARSNPDIDDEFARRLEEKVQGAVRVLRNDLLSLEDLSLLEDDFMAGIQMIILRRYVEVGRVMDFRAPEQNRAILDGRLKRGWMSGLYAVIKEMVTNDLKYGTGQSVWNFAWDEREFRIDFSASSRYHLASHGTGRGTAGMIRRLSEIGGEMRMSIQEDQAAQDEPRRIEVRIRVPF